MSWFQESWGNSIPLMSMVPKQDGFLTPHLSTLETFSNVWRHFWLSCLLLASSGRRTYVLHTQCEGSPAHTTKKSSGLKHQRYRGLESLRWRQSCYYQSLRLTGEFYTVSPSAWLEAVIKYYFVICAYIQMS